MSHLKHAASALVLGLAVGICQPGPVPAQEASTVGGAASLVPADLEFVLKAAGDGLAEIALGELAQEKAGSAEVKQFAQHMIAEHGQANEELMRLATARGTQPPQQPPEAAEEVERTLGAYSGQEFDEVYVAQQVAAHHAAMALFEHAAEHGQNPDLKAYAQKYAPKIKEHYEQAQALMGKVGKKS